MTILTTTIRCGDTLHVLAAATAEELAGLAVSTAKRLLKPNGHAVTLACGESSWIIDEEIHPAEWHADGNRLLARRVRYDKAADGSLTTSILKTVWVRG
jgi:hypothetical protein